jgi:membrane-associated protein
MEAVIEFVQPYFEEWGYVIVFALGVLENSAFVGFVVPGDLVLLLAGFYAERSTLDLPPIVLLAFVAALLGDSLGYAVGRFAGRRLVNRFGKRLFPPDRLARVDLYFAEYGTWAVAMGRLTPVVRSVNTFAAGMARMPFPKFLGAVAIAASVWAVAYPVLGFVFSGSFEAVRRALGPAGVVLLLIFVGGLYWTYRRMVRRLAERTESV